MFQYFSNLMGFAKPRNTPQMESFCDFLKDKEHVCHFCKPPNLSFGISNIEKPFTFLDYVSPRIVERAVHVDGLNGDKGQTSRDIYCTVIY
jgi:hypothetical protein